MHFERHLPWRKTYLPTSSHTFGDNLLAIWSTVLRRSPQHCPNGKQVALCCHHFTLTVTLDASSPVFRSFEHTRGEFREVGTMQCRQPGQRALACQKAAKFPTLEIRIHCFEHLLDVNWFVQSRFFIDSDSSCRSDDSSPDQSGTVQVDTPWQMQVVTDILEPRPLCHWHPGQWRDNRSGSPLSSGSARVGSRLGATRRVGCCRLSSGLLRKPLVPQVKSSVAGWDGPHWKDCFVGTAHHLGVQHGSRVFQPRNWTTT